LLLFLQSLHHLSRLPLSLQCSPYVPLFQLR
jgi:hypothetical protein